jgi:hypothetical protein
MAVAKAADNNTNANMNMCMMGDGWRFNATKIKHNN